MADVDNKIKMIVEGLLLAAGKPLSLSVIAGVFSEDERPDNAELRQVLDAIAEDCNDRGFELREVASGFRFQVKQEIGEWIARLWEEKPPRYSRALLETLALIAYRQPITRGDIEEIRGVGVSSTIMRTLLDREWVRVVGQKDVPGKPALYATTRQFLDYFNLKSLQDLPPLSEIRELAASREEFDVEDDLVNRKILELPTEEDNSGQSEVLGDEGELLVFEADELPDEEEAAALARKPLDEILGLVSEDDADDEAALDDAVTWPDDEQSDQEADDDEPEGNVPEAESGDDESEGDAPQAESDDDEPEVDDSQADSDDDESEGDASPAETDDKEPGGNASHAGSDDEDPARPTEADGQGSARAVAAEPAVDDSPETSAH